MVASFKYQGNILDKAYKHVQEDIDIFFENVLPKDKSAKLLVYLLSKHTHDFILQQAIKLVLTHGIKTIFSSYDFAKLHESNKLPNSLILATAHSVKGNEYDEVTIGNDINELVKEIINNINQSENTHSISEYERSELNLAYVAASRAKKKLNNATFLCL
jgi:superfamily I DNA/RNA helicase